ncbi:similar to Saccharomyces cerevisiae YMR036C MIH1 Protein tyrosine phosphatase involved in cell cycle control [Maudiozyma saulgeensis]|uniref:M-phase inducer phosphatase n=1 Tax=Maudiozyma saulgeensis TaxID=1789683 RepID=A0A1X7R7Z2_9SACH|nr:similar to Saccharomyces cerevisiae YMR036C MIH1 Protein tyrosine phosphatase involved in cell cycle control [Kazachstania saulgeensis]
MDSLIENAVKDETKTLHRMSLGSPFNQKLFKNMHTLFKSGDSKKKKQNKETNANVNQVSTGSALDSNSSGLDEKSPVVPIYSNETGATKMSPLALHIDSEDLMLSPSMMSPTTNRRNKLHRLNSTVTSPTVQRRTSLTQSRKNSLGLYRTESFKKKKFPMRNSSVKRINSICSLNNQDKDLNIVSPSHCINNSNKSNTPAQLERENSTLRNSNIPTYHMHDIDHYSSKSKMSLNDTFPRISVNTLKDIIVDNIHKPHYDDYMIIDCRFAYEYQGGHIKGALNFSRPEDIATHLIDKRMTDNTIHGSRRCLLIFHCEFSAQRGPTLASSFRNHDRCVNHDNYPHLFYPDIVILDGGYKAFFDYNSSLCYPINYVEMDSKENIIDCEIQMDIFRKESRKIITRSNSLRTFTSASSISSNSNNLPMKGQRNSKTWKESRILEERDSNIFRPDPPPKLFYKHLNHCSHDGSGASSDDICSSLASTSSTISIGGMQSSDNIHSDPYFSYEENDEFIHNHGQIMARSPSRRLTFTKS